MNMGSENVNEDLFGLECEDFGEEINSRMNVTNISSGGSNRGGSGVTYPSFQPIIEAIGQYGVGMKGPNFHEGTMVMQSIDASSMIKTGEKMFELLDKWVEQVGEENVIQVITDNHSSYVMTGRLLELNCPHLYWTPCVAHCLDLMLEDIGKLPNIKRTLERAISLNGYIYNRSRLLNMMRQFPRQRELLRLAKTRASGCEWNWSIFENIHSKRRNRLDHQHLNDSVYIKYNRALKRRYNERNTIDPISLKDIDDSNEWLIGRMEYKYSHGGAQDDFVFDDDNLTWGEVARATGADEPNEDEDGDMVDSVDEEDGKGYKCGDGNDDDDDFLDLEAE
ncbi:hypothetical protein CK203_092457 [Vitis vinifera]|uniref:DUF659 domain-containing protein n=1 Tax=Vitis vinifera TaxID=29760 RepID=A0A438DXY8_VITVI|nr:hypothetical protein CK203_092457 [Vitis vinifera]